MRIYLLLASFLIVSLSPIHSPARADEPTATSSGADADAATYAALDAWLRADQLNRRCNLLNYFEIRLIEDGINGAKDRTPEGRQTQAAIGWPGFDARLAELSAMLDSHRASAKAAVADRACSTDDADIRAVRAALLRNLLKLLTAAQTAPTKASDRAGRKAVAQDLVNFTAALYGDNFQTVGQQLVAELQASPIQPDNAWKALKPTVEDGLWQTRLAGKGFAFKPDPDAGGYYRAVKADGSGGLAARLGARANPSIEDASGYNVEINRVQGVMDDGRMIVLIGKDAADWGPSQLKAELMVQKTPGWDQWRSQTWRRDALHFTAEPLADADCPADFCFVFPAAASDAVRTRQAEGSASGYNYELFIAPPERFPPSETAGTASRNNYYPPLLATAAAGDD